MVEDSTDLVINKRDSSVIGSPHRPQEIHIAALVAVFIAILMPVPVGMQMLIVGRQERKRHFDGAVEAIPRHR